MKDLPLPVYDFFAYFACGLLLLLIFGYAFDISWPILQQPATLQFIVGVVVAYTVGYAVSLLSGVVIEQWLVNKGLGRSDFLLLGQEASTVTPCHKSEGKIERCEIGWGEPESANVNVALVNQSIRECIAKQKNGALLMVGQSPIFYKRCQLRTLQRNYRSRWLRNTVFRRAFEPLPPTARLLVLNRAKREQVKIGSIQSKALHIAKSKRAYISTNERV